MPKPLLYDIFCGAGGATRGYQNAGFRVIGIDNRPQPHYCGDGFIQMDAFEFMRRYMAGEYEPASAFAASPPCQRYSVETPQKYKCNHPDLIGQTRELLLETGKIFIIENVTGARFHLRNPIMLCGSMFHLPIWRHRWFEIHPAMFILTRPCDHSNIPVLITGTTRRNGYPRTEPSADVRRAALGTPWMVISEMDDAIPPFFTEFIGKQLMQFISQKERII
jgi:DNA (cytosine-5)-methyltransferase 1